MFQFVSKYPKTVMISRRFFTSSRRLPTRSRSIDVQTHFIFGANTDVGKTVLSAGLVRASSVRDDGEGTTTSTLRSAAHYIKPLQCGGSDQNFVLKHAPNVSSTTTLFDWDTPASPHVASRKENKPVSDRQVCQALEDCLTELSISSSSSSPTADSSICWVETAGGVLSPSSASPDNNLSYHASGASDGSSSSSSSWGWVTQGDLYQPFMGIGSVILVGDGRLGGISATLSALESLIIRGYDVAGIILLETGYGNQDAIREYASRKLKLRSGDGTPLFSDPEASIISLPQLPPEPEPLTEWYESEEVTDTLHKFVHGHLSKTWKERSITNLSTAAESSSEKYESNEDIDRVVVGVGESSMALATAAAFGRYGKKHNASSADRLSKRILQRYTGWSNRVLFCRDGQSAMQLAVRMGMSQFQVDQPYLLSTTTTECVVCCVQGLKYLDLRYLDLEYTTVQFDVATLNFQDGVGWCVPNSDRSFGIKEQAFDIESRMSSDTATFSQYKVSISREWEELEKICQIGSIVVTTPSTAADDIEIVDPLWYRALWEIAESKSIPFIVDERGDDSSSTTTINGWQDVMGCDPDLVISEVGGVGPLGVVVSGERISDNSAAVPSFTPSAAESVSAMHALDE